jgi:predicted RNA-binding protein with RPS1 domain
MEHDHTNEEPTAGADGEATATPAAAAAAPPRDGETPAVDAAGDAEAPACAAAAGDAEAPASAAAAGDAEAPACAAATGDAEAPASAAAEGDAEAPAAPVTEADSSTEAERRDLLPEQRRLTDLAARYPEIGPPLAELAFKIGEREWAERLVRMGLDQPTPGVEFYAVTANAARREGRHDDAFAATLAAARRFAAMAAGPTDREEGARLLALVRQGFASLLHDLQDVKAQPAFAQGLAEVIPGLEARLAEDPLYHVILAQVLWYEDPARSEAAWDRATAAPEAEMAWNARGTWYKDALGDAGRAEAAYRKGLAGAPRSALLLHNLAQLLLEQAVRPDVDVDATRRLVRDAETLLRQGLRCEAPRGLRRFIHSTLERLDAVRASLPPRVGGRDRERDRDRERGRDRDRPRGDGPAASPAAAPAPAPPAPPAPPPEAGAVLTGRVAAITHFGAFVSLGGHRGLLHKSEMAHQRVDDPATIVKIGDELEVKVLGVEERGGQLRISLSRRALLPAPAGTSTASPAPTPSAAGGLPRGERPRDERPRDERPRDERPRDGRPRDGRAADARPRDARSRDDGPRHARPPREGAGPRRERYPDDRPPPTSRPAFPTDRATDVKLARLGEILLAKLKGSLPEK